MDENSCKQMQNLCYPQTEDDIPITLEQIHIFKMSRTNSTYLQTRSHTSPSLLWEGRIYENVISPVQ